MSPLTGLLHGASPLPAQGVTIWDERPGEQLAIAAGAAYGLALYVPETDAHWLGVRREIVGAHARARSGSLRQTAS